MLQQEIYLAIDTTNSLCSICLFNHNSIIDFKIGEVSSNQSKNLFEFIDQIFLTHNLNYNDLNEIFITIGPGSFTGIRVGLAAAKGISLVTQIPISGISNFQVFAYQINKEIIDDQFSVILNARRDQFYLQSFTKNFSEIHEPQLINKSELVDIKNKIFTEDSILEINHLENVETINAKISAEEIAKCALFFKNQKLLKNIQPLYIKLPDAKIPNS